jgi:hypothetical protein
MHAEGVGGDGIVVCGSKAAHFTSPPSAMSFAAGKQKALFSFE